MLDNDFRVDSGTAALLADALKLQAQFGFEYAHRHLQAQGVEAQRAQRLLAIRYDRRSRRHGVREQRAEPPARL